MVQIKSRSLTLEEFLKLPETEPASEYIDGQMIQKPMPKGKHSTIQTELATAVNVVLKSRQAARAFSELRCTFGGRSIVPEVSVFTGSRIPRDEKGEIADTFETHPDWTIEILSPEQSQTKVTKNILHCLNYGSEMGWMIDPAEQTIFVYLPKQQPMIFDEPEQLLLVPTFAGELELRVGSIFGWPLE
jgi:Uma2 family endonuclease